MKKLLFLILGIVEQAKKSIGNKSRSLFKKLKWVEKSAEEMDKNILRLIHRRSDKQRKRYSWHCKFTKNIIFFEEIEKHINSIVGCSAALFFLTSRLTSNLITPKDYQGILWTIHSVSFGLGIIVAFITLLHMVKAYCEFQVGWSDRVLQQYLKKYWNNIKNSSYG